MATLYRQYRPQEFRELVGQDHVRRTLERAVTADKLTHAYLFFGPRGTGKTTTARLLAKRVNCENPEEAEACGKCASCVAMQTGKHIDVIEIDAASNRGIDDIRALREAAAFVPALGKYKIYIIDEVHMLTKEAASALLKTLEEPVPHVMFILATTELHKVLSTIASRCQVYRFRRASREELQQRLNFLLKQEKREAESDALDFIIDRSDGCFRDAESLLGQMLTLQEGKVTRDDMATFLGLPSPELLDQFLQSLTRGQSGPALEVVDALFAEGVDPEQFLREAVRSARDEAVRLALEEPATWAKDEKSATTRLPQIIRALLQALQDLAYVPQPLIAIQLAILTVCTEKGNETPPPATPIAKAAPVQQSASVTTKKEVQPAPVVVKAKKVPEAAAGSVTVQMVTDAWPQLIQDIQKTNPVAATFLRALHPVSVSGEEVTIQAQFSLHRTFFERTEVREQVTTALSALLNETVRLIFTLDETGARSNASLAEQRRQHEQKFQKTVQEMFGTA